LVPNQWINGADAMARNRPNDYILDPVKDQKPIADIRPDFDWDAQSKTRRASDR
jgi:hypothetical protein